MLLIEKWSLNQGNKPEERWVFLHVLQGEAKAKQTRMSGPLYWRILGTKGLPPTQVKYHVINLLPEIKPISVTP